MTNQYLTKIAASVSSITRDSDGSISYRGQTFPGFNKPREAPEGDKHKKMVLAKKGDQVKLVRYGARGYGHNYSEAARKSYLARSAGIKGADDPFSANHWARKDLWGKRSTVLSPESAKK
jgi:hypothetical protein